MRSFFSLPIAFVCCVLISGCKDFIVKNIKNKSVNVVSPADQLKTPNNAVVFWWEELDGAEKYKLQIVKPDFGNVAQLMVDTNITGTKFTYIFTPGAYQWRIKAVNAGGSTAYTTRTLVIDTTSNLNYLSVHTIAPASYSVTASKSITFSWDPLAVATSYNLKVFAGSAGGASVLDVNTANTNYAYTFSTAGVYFWKINASNAFSNSPYTAPISFKIDQTAPTAPLLVRPLNLSVVKDTAYFRWSYNSGSANTDIAYDSLIVADFVDSNFTAPHVAVVQRPPTGSGNLYKINSLISFPTTSLTVSSYYWWKVKAVDSVGNVSPASQVFKVKLAN